MKIGDLARETGVPARMIRYYEAQGLLAPERGENGYRVYTDAHVGRVQRIRNHIAAGLPTRLVRIDFAAMLTDELAGLDERIACLTMSRKTIADVLDSVGKARPASQGS